MPHRTKRTQKKEKEFIEALRVTGGNVSRACESVSLSRNAVYRWRESDGALALLWDEAVEYGLDVLESEARRRALDGILQKKFTKSGEPIIDPATGEHYAELTYSDTLLIFLLKGGRPEKYRDRTDVTSGGKPLDFASLALAAAAAQQ